MERTPHRRVHTLGFGLYKRSVYLKNVLHERIILFVPLPICIAHPSAIRLHDYWAVYDIPPPSPDSPCVCHALYTYMLNTRGGRRKYGILFRFSVFYEYSNLEYEHIYVIYKVHQAEYVIHILVVAPQEYVNIYSTRRTIQ